MTLQRDAADARAALGTAVEEGLDDAAVMRAHARAVWSCLAEPGDGVAGALIGLLGPVRALEAALGEVRVDAEAAGIPSSELHQGRARWRPRARGVSLPLEAARRAGVRLVTPEHPCWPVRVDDLGVHAPICLWMRGDPASLAVRGPAVAVVGARAATAYGEHVAAEIAAGCADAGITVVSGAAYGIDGAAHRAALLAGGPTVAVLAGGVERPYPAGHVRLIDEIAVRGAVATEVPCGTSPTKWRFLARNRVIAAMADATIVVEAGWRSGSLNTAHHAAALGRPVGAVPGPVTSATSAGSHRLLREADAVCVTGAADVREVLGLGEALFPDAGEYTGDHTRVLDALSLRTARDATEVARRSGLGPDQAAATLGLLELDGRAARHPDGWRRTPAPAR